MLLYAACAGGGTALGTERAEPGGLRAASSDSCEALVNYGWQRGEDDAVRVTDPHQKAPLLRRVAARELREDEGKPLDAAGKERALTGACRPARGPEEPVGGVLQRTGTGEQRLLVPGYRVMLASHDRLPLAELGRRHRGQQEPEHALQGAVAGPGPAASAVPLARSAAGLLWRCPECITAAGLGAAGPSAAARAASADPVLVDSVGRLTCSARRRLCSRGNLRWDGLLHAASRREPDSGRAQRNGADAEPAGVPVRPEPGAQQRRCGRRAPAGGARSLGDGMRGPRRTLRSSHAAPQHPSRGMIRESPGVSQPPRALRVPPERTGLHPQPAPDGSQRPRCRYGWRQKPCPWNPCVAGPAGWIGCP